MIRRWIRLERRMLLWSLPLVLAGIGGSAFRCWAAADGVLALLARPFFSRMPGDGFIVGREGDGVSLVLVRPSFSLPPGEGSIIGVEGDRALALLASSSFSPAPVAGPITGGEVSAEGCGASRAIL